MKITNTDRIPRDPPETNLHMLQEKDTLKHVGVPWLSSTSLAHASVSYAKYWDEIKCTNISGRNLRLHIFMISSLAPENQVDQHVLPALFWKQQIGSRSWHAYQVNHHPNVSSKILLNLILQVNALGFVFLTRQPYSTQCVAPIIATTINYPTSVD